MDKFKFLSGVPLVFGFGLALTPVVFGVGPRIEARLFPVVKGTVIENETKTAHGMSFFVAFRKVRACDFLGLVWYEGPVRHAVDFEPLAEASPATRPVGEQFAGPWLVQDLTNLQGSRALVYHRCHPLWTTISIFYED